MEHYEQVNKHGIKTIDIRGDVRNGLTYLSTFVHHELGTEEGQEFTEVLAAAVKAALEEWLCSR